jgi:hypothetical protein
VSDVKKVPAQEEIELRAYEIYLERGCKEGNALDDWLDAEKELSDQGRKKRPIQW